MAETSDRDLHPENGGRFVLTRADGDEPRYAVVVFLPRGQRLQTELAWDGNRAHIDPPLADAWAQTETLKLARGLRRRLPRSLTRWRGR